MKIAGIRKTSLIDYPGKISTVIFTQGCNFCCPYCHNGELIPAESEEKEYMDSCIFLDFLDERSQLLDGVVITGGEPTLQPDLVEFISRIREKDYQIKLDTNGSSFPVIEELVESDLVDFLAVDIKGAPGNYDRYMALDSGPVLASVRDTVKLVLESNIEYELRTTVVPGLHDREEIKNIANFISGAEQFVIQNFRPDTTFDSRFEDKTRFPDDVLEDFRQAAREVLSGARIEIRD
ncbi:MAG: anaerobic ribonucleoside-triphosphate reductase activating protein [Halanaerobiaceae bacterium]